MKIIISSLITTFVALTSIAQETRAVDTWSGILNKPELATYFGGVFNKMGFIIAETNEEFTVIHHGDHFTIENGIDSKSVDYVVNLKMENVTNLVAHSSDNTIDEHESYRIMAALFTPLTEASLTSPTMSKPLMRKMADIENFIHVNLNGPDGETVSHTLIYLNKSWTVIPGKHGNAKRVFNLSPKDAIDYQRQVFIALQANNMKDWKAFKKWYITWREGVSVTIE